jgi:hypothetical protein
MIMIVDPAWVGTVQYESNVTSWTVMIVIHAMNYKRGLFRRSHVIR